MDAHCVGIVVPLYPMGCDRIHGRLLCTKRHASSFVNRLAAMRPTQAAANLRKGKRNNKFGTLFSEPTSSNSSFFGYFSFASSSFFLDCIFFFFFFLLLAVSLTDIRTLRSRTAYGHLSRRFNKESGVV